ncbi:MAG TPA: YsnF/AvaK domain-containing protein [Pyrinomonadaceae bacterium]
MTEELGGVVFDAEGVRAALEGPAEGETDGRARVRLADGLRLLLPTGEMVRREDGALLFRGSFEELASAARVREWKEGGPRVQEDDAVVPVVEEELRVGKRVVETGRVRVTKSVREREEVLDEPLVREEYDVERVPVNVFVGEPVGPRHEGDTLIVPVLEEVLVVEKRLLVREELRITRRQTEERETRRVTLLSEEVSVERTGPQDEPVEADKGVGRPA